MLIILGFTLVTELEDIKFDDLPDHQRGPEVQICCLTVGVWWSTTHPGLVMDPGLGNHIAIRSVESGDPDVHVVVRDFISTTWLVIIDVLQWKLETPRTDFNGF